MRKAAYTPMDVNWMPGGRQPIAVHFATGRIYVLMHMGEYWSEYKPAEEIWVLDANAHRLIVRHALPDSLRASCSILPSARMPSAALCQRRRRQHPCAGCQTLERVRSIDNSGGGILYTVQP